MFEEYDRLCNLDSKIRLGPTELMLETFGVCKIKSSGTVRLCRCCSITVTNSKNKILGLESCQHLKLIKRVNNVHAVGVGKQLFIE